jgi:hypothetical protein
MKVRDEELFGPVVLIEPYDDFEDALAEVNRSRYGLQAGLLTRDAGRILTAYRELEVGALIVGDTPSWRLDPMPYGGVKDSGLGREGLRSAMEEMTEPRMLVMAGIGPKLASYSTIVYSLFGYLPFALARRAAQRLRCASAMLLRASALNFRRFFLAFLTGAAFGAGVVVAEEALPIPFSRARAWVSLAISESICWRIESILMLLA